mmetsp:Transcript_31929/g.74756  ORF Transcript_31929/g.74756 Transcript_31929/m.74756 type:complete len:115 (+) Transcript_31929:100-444(+)|eukprot:CAMPEP_0178457914 /NCGR_PEP_ID=MMETSP0689_2-20121128/47271_1 /TAXON_ID=160604 /ORGANISM="Amphidinium massartii, Strain CS-259" /LENGTH=114 /DNA_ID=CAMNT_0020084197 /DNA_START=96 /DNA_END=440 /DNA_ORIENTATION=+
MTRRSPAAGAARRVLICLLFAVICGTYTALSFLKVQTRASTFRRPVRVTQRAAPDDTRSGLKGEQVDEEWAKKEMDLYADAASQYATTGDKDGDWRLAAFAGIFILLIAVGFMN